MAHPDGIIGFPLRLLARENYEKLVAVKGADQVALVTGEEKIIPHRARWFSCTVEAMPRDRKMAFIAIDEVQLSADPDRGHIFSDRILHCRGTAETMFLGSDTMRPILKALFPEIRVEIRPRLSALSHAGHISLSKLPRRSAIVAFSVTEVYAIADMLRRRRGGCAVVMGQLSPQTRNAQVALFENREVDYLVATDAIGMGLNMDVDHVALAARDKFDGDHYRALSPLELAQIFGRAGRGLKDGTFGTTADACPLESDLVQRIESHHFAPLEHIIWRNDALDFASIEALKRSLSRSPPLSMMRRGREASDMLNLDALSRSQNVVSRANTCAQVRLLWDICQIPDFRRIGDTSHAQLCEQLYLSLSEEGRVPKDWFARQINHYSNVEGDIDTLMHRLTAMRTCTYVASKRDWYPQNENWEIVTRKVEELLSDALHEKLKAKYIDRKASSLSRHVREASPKQALSSITSCRDLIVEGHRVGRLEGFSFVLDQDLTHAARDFALKAGRRAVLRYLPTRVQEIERAQDEAFSIDVATFSLTWQGQMIARLTRGTAILKPEVKLVSSELEDQQLKSRLVKRLRRFLSAHLRDRFAKLYRALEALTTSPSERALAHLLEEHCGIIPIEALPDASLSSQRRHLSDAGLIFGTRAIFLRDMLRPLPGALRCMLISLHGEQTHRVWDYRRVSFRRTGSTVDEGVISGFLPSGPVLIRLDIAERWIAILAQLTHSKNAALPDGMEKALGVHHNDVPLILKSWRFRFHEVQKLHPAQYGPASPLILCKRQFALPRRKKSMKRGKLTDHDTSEKAFDLLRHWKFK